MIGGWWWLASTAHSWTGWWITKGLLRLETGEPMCTSIWLFALAASLRKEGRNTVQESSWILLWERLINWQFCCRTVWVSKTAKCWWTILLQGDNGAGDGGEPTERWIIINLGTVHGPNDRPILLFQQQTRTFARIDQLAKEWSHIHLGHLLWGSLRCRFHPQLAPQSCCP